MPSKKRYQPKLPKGQLISDYDEFAADEANNPEVVQPDEVVDPMQLFASDAGQEQNAAKELFNVQNPKSKTEMIDDEDKDCSLLYEMSRKYYEPRGIFMLKEALDEFVLLRFSKNRQSRKEFVQAHQDIQKQKSGNIFENLLGRGQQ